ncbi:CHASE3 domain-containing protein [Actinopolymorpha sp. B11F2]|uniref:CHASE3 domain-containing protein n=1 Tax=Actinopolymorpha sp. B11F2 TaxID=3160862 RepID=UPI0032E49790
MASGLLALVVAAAFVVVLVASEHRADAGRLTRHALQVVAAAHEFERVVVDLETGQRGYLLTGDKQFLQPWNAARRELPRTSMRLEQLTDGTPLAATADQLVRSGESYVSDYSVPLVEAAQGDPGVGTQGGGGALDAAATAEGKRRVDAIRADVDRLSTNADELARQGEASWNRSARATNVAIAAGIAGSVALVVVFGMYLSRTLIRPVRQTAGTANRLAAGDLAARTPTSGVGEVGTLQRAFNTMAESLERNRDELGRVVDEQTVLRRLATLVARGEPPEVVFAAVAEEVGEVLGADGTRLLRYEADQTAMVVTMWGTPVPNSPVGSRLSLEGRNVAALALETGQGVRITSFTDAPGSIARSMREMDVHSAVGAPVVVAGQLWGVLSAYSTHEDRFAPGTETRFAEFTDLVAIAIANTQARTDLLASRARVVAATDQARRRIERDLHDGTQQRLVSLMLDLRSVATGVFPGQPDLRSSLEGMTRELGDTIEELREVARGIHPALLSDAGLVPALRSLARRSAIAVDLDVDITTRLRQAVEVAAYYVVAEALTNASKYANASVVHITGAVADGHLHLSVCDDGVGGADPSRGSGLVGLIDRIEALGGTLTISSPPRQGTTIELSLPVEGD